MRVLITGGSGYIGSRLLEVLVQEPELEEAIVLDIRPPRAMLPKVRFVKRSVTEDLTDLTADRGRPVDAVLHLAWVLNPLRDAARQRQICIGGTRRVLEACAAGRVKQLLFMSSGTAYGAHPEHDHPLQEFEPLRDHYHFQYSAEKREAEGMCRRFAADHPGTLLQIVRPCVVGGPNVSNFLFRALDKSFVPVALGHDPEIQLVHEDDVARALLAILKSRVPGAFNVAADGTMTIREAYQMLGARVLALPLPVLRAAAWGAWWLDLKALVEAPGDFVWFVAYPWLLSNRRLKEELGFQFRYTTREVLKSYLRAHRETWAARTAGSSGDREPAGAPHAPPPAERGATALAETVGGECQRR
ncbi:MAG: NAD-dependent epimerase [Planctomycetota bacterium]|nr:MAG: NAD-dependent epimerase [Planctomycetota bacterium]